MSERVLIALSGGVDSAAAALLLIDAGHRVEAAHLRLFCGDGGGQSENNARGVAESLGIPFHVLDFSDAFSQRIVEPFVAEYLAGRTPNPCVMCNPGIKMGVLLDWALDRGFDALATGHYARIVRDPASGLWELRRPVDASKDQTYYLYRLSQRQLARFRAPLAEWTKPQARALLAERGVAIHQKGESQEICFIPNDDYRAFLESRAPRGSLPEEGPIVDVNGREIGRHAGIHRYTIGQRRGIGGGAPRPLYVVDIRARDSAVVVGEADDLLAEGLETSEMVWQGAEPAGALDAMVKIRYRSEPRPCRVEPLKHEGGKADWSVGARVCFNEPQRAVTPGQSAVIYDPEYQKVLGGGLIEKGMRHA